MIKKNLLVSQILKDAGFEYNIETAHHHTFTINKKAINNSLNEMIGLFSEDTDVKDLHIIISGNGPIWAFMYIEQVLFDIGIGKLSVIIPHSTEYIFDIFVHS